MAKTFVMGDIHGASRALRQCLDRSGFDLKTDHLIFLGDVCDGWPETREAVDILLGIPHLKFLLGNHDQMALPWMKHGEISSSWFRQGGEATIKSYRDGVPSAHISLLENALQYLVLDNRCFVHAGFNPTLPIADQDTETFLWDRVLAYRALSAYLSKKSDSITPYNEVFIGHTPTSFGKPVIGAGIWMMDTGAGWSGVLSMMNVDTKEIFLSDPVPSLYPGVAGRGQR